MAAFGAIATIIAGIIVIIAAGAVLYVIYRVKCFIAPVQTLIENFDEQEFEMEMNPKSVNAMTSVYLPRIEKDFPEFNYFEFKAKAENMMKSAFNAITTEDIACLTNASPDLTSQVNNIISSNRANHVREVYRDIDIHRTEIKNYRKAEGSCIITLQTSVGYIHYFTETNGSVVKGSSEHTFQTRYDIDLMYVQDVEKIADGEKFAANNCPNCGAPIKGIGNKACPYCGSEVEGINIRTWAINKLTEC